MFAVANSALINMLMASRLIYGMARQDVLPPVLGRVHHGPADAVGRDHLHHGHRLRAHLLRQHERQRRRAGPRRHDRAAAARRVHDRQHRRARAAHATRSTARTSVTPTVHAGHRCARLLLLHPAGHRARPDPVHDRRLAARHRRGAVGAHLGARTGRSSGRRPTCATRRTSAARTPRGTDAADARARSGQADAGAGAGTGPVDSRSTSSVGMTTSSVDWSPSSSARSSSSAAAVPRPATSWRTVVSPRTPERT